MKEIRMKPIGKVESNFKKSSENKNTGEILSKIIIKPKLSECLDGVEEYSHLVILYWMHQLKKPDKKCFSRGILAARFPQRPNPIGLTIVELIKRKGNFLIVKGLDAFDASPVIDIKPYTGHPKDLVLNFRSPDKF